MKLQLIAAAISFSLVACASTEQKKLALETNTPVVSDVAATPAVGAHGYPLWFHPRMPICAQAPRVGPGGCLVQSRPVVTFCVCAANITRGLAGYSWSLLPIVGNACLHKPLVISTITHGRTGRQ